MAGGICKINVTWLPLSDGSNIISFFGKYFLKYSLVMPYPLWVFVVVENMILNNLICNLKAYFDHKDNICTVYLFGSVVKGKNRKNSDVDVGILFSEDMDSIERFDLKLEIACELEDLLGTKMDIVDLNSAVP